MPAVFTERWVADGTGLTRRRGRASRSSRNTLIYGLYRPQEGVTCGLRDSSAYSSAYNPSADDTVTIPDGAVISGKTIYGDISFGGSATLDNCLLVGGNHIPTTNQSVVRCDNDRGGSGGGIVTLTDCEIAPRLPALNRDGIRGNRYRAYRCYVHDTIDGIAAFALSTQNGGVADVEVKGCKVEGLRYFYPDYDNGVSGAAEHTDGTHNDALVISGGTNITVVGNYLRATTTTGVGTNPDKPWLVAGGWANGAAVIVNEDAGTQIDSTCSITQNWLEGGLSQLNVKTGVTFTFTGNRHYVNTAVGTGHSGYWIRYDTSATAVTGINDGGGTTITNTTNIWADGPSAGLSLTTPRASGVHFNA